jgi:hypothetical protein
MTKILRTIARDPFLNGFARAVDLFGVLSRPMPYERQRGSISDFDAMRRDWEAVGEDLSGAMDEVDRLDQEVVGSTT